MGGIEMDKMSCCIELRGLLEKLQMPVLLVEVGPIAKRVAELCDMLDKFEREGK